MNRKLSFIFIILAMVMMQAVEFIPHHHHDGIIICLDEDSEEGDEDDETLCVTTASYLMNDTHHEYFLSAFIPVFKVADVPEPQPVRLDTTPVDRDFIPDLYRPGPTALRAPPVSFL